MWWAAFVRYFVGLYAFALLHLLLYAQLSIVGMRSFETPIKKKVHALAAEDGAHSMDDAEEINPKEEAAKHEFLSSGLEYFLGTGLTKLKDHVDAAVAANDTLER